MKSRRIGCAIGIKDQQWGLVLSIEREREYEKVNLMITFRFRESFNTSGTASVETFVIPYESHLQKYLKHLKHLSKKENPSANMPDFQIPLPTAPCSTEVSSSML